jgi:acetyl esterase/lipase
VTAYLRLLDRGYKPSRIVVAGDSAGGYLAFAAPLRALSEGLPAPAGIVALSPLTDLDHTAKLAHANARLDPYIPVSRLPLLYELWQDGPDPLVCPVDADLAQLPPTLIQAGSSEALLCDAELMAARLAAADVPCRLQIWERQLHVFQAYSQVIPEGFSAIAEIGSFIRARVTPGTPAHPAGQGDQESASAATTASTSALRSASSAAKRSASIFSAISSSWDMRASRSDLE